MATIEELLAAGELIRFDAQLSWREQEERVILLHPQAARWIVEKLPDEVSNWNLDISPEEQLDDFTHAFCAGFELIFERQVRPIFHIKHGIWELKTADLRLFGWFPRRDWFLCTAVNVAHRIKQSGLYGPYRDEAVRLREQLDLDEPKFIPGEDPNDVITAWRYPTS